MQTGRDAARYRHGDWAARAPKPHAALWPQRVLAAEARAASDHAARGARARTSAARAPPPAEHAH